MKLPSNISWEELAQYFSGELTEAEEARFVRKLNKNPKALEEFEIVQSLWENVHREPITNAFDVDQGWNEMKAKMNPASAPPNTPDTPIVALTQPPAQIEPSDRISWGRWAGIAASLLLVALAMGTIYRNYVADRSEVLVTTTDKVEKTELRLKNGIQVVVNEQSRLSYPPKFKGKRIIELEGEAWFEVKKADELPFFVQTPYTRLEVHSTAFNVKTTPDSTMVQVENGFVNFQAYRAEANSRLFGSNSDEPSQPLTEEIVKLGQGEKATFHLDSQNFAYQPSDPNAYFWRTDTLRYENKTLKAVLTDIERRTHTFVRLLNTEDNSRSFTGSIPLSQDSPDSFQADLKKLAKQLGYKLDYVAGVYVFK